MTYATVGGIYNRGTRRYFAKQMPNTSLCLPAVDNRQTSAYTEVRFNLEEQGLGLPMRIVILGCGRTGAALARIMAAEGHKVTLIEWNSDSLERLGGKFSGAVIPGNGLDEDILKKAGIEQADLFAALTEGDNRNLMAAQIAKERFRVPKVVAKVNDPIRAQAYRERGIYTICYGLIGSSIIRDLAYDRPLGSVEEYNVLPPELED